MTKPVCAVVGIGPQNGTSFARRFASEGYAVALLSRKTEYSSNLAAEFESAKAYACDVTDPLAIETAFAPAKASQRSLAQAMARHLWPSGIHVSLIIIDGGVKSLVSDVDVEAPETLNPDDIATTAYFLSQQPRSAWSFEVDVRPSQESW